ncbi:Uma2 family endonuclease [Streptomyces sp. GMY02]|uniref:Uma2 family endonuclease n=1 Tax=Streptomyces sp. GMY02 TaxID=1333528 RepID=UPI0020B6B5C7|nr:Uma2 family endonuclease [Streptomyces sp. GMY02]
MALPVSEYEPYESYEPDEPYETEGGEVDYMRMLRQMKGKIPAMSVEAAFDVFSAAAPVGWRVELVEGEIHVAPPANGEHEEIVAEMTVQVTVRRKNPQMRSYCGIGLYVPGASVTGKVVPDLVIAPKGSFASASEYHDPAPVLLIAEVTSRSTGDNDRVKKIRGYARAGIPVYLLIDREADQAVLCTMPFGEDYKRKVPYKLSEPVPLPEPLGFELDTGEF